MQKSIPILEGFVGWGCEKEGDYTGDLYYSEENRRKDGEYTAGIVVCLSSVLLSSCAASLRWNELGKWCLVRWLVMCFWLNWTVKMKSPPALLLSTTAATSGFCQTQQSLRKEGRWEEEEEDEEVEAGARPWHSCIHSPSLQQAPTAPLWCAKNG